MHAALALLAIVTSGTAAGQDKPTPPRTGVRGEPTARGVIDMRAELPEWARVRHEPPQAIHPPVGPPADRAGEVPAGRVPPALAPEREGVPAPLGPSPAITNDFGALPDNMTLIPPDTHGAVGPSHLLVTLNSQVRVSNRAGTALVADRTLNGFWGGIAGGSGTFDPRAVYDPFANRFVVVSCDDARSATSALLLAVSQTADPTGSWNTFRIDADAGDTLWADFPSVGFNNKWLVVQFNLFTFAGAFVRSEIYVFDRLALYGGSAAFTRISDPMGFTQVPALTYDPTQNELFLVEDWNSGAGALRLLKISGAIGSEVLSQVGFPVAAPWQFNPIQEDHAPQSGTVERIATNDARIQSLQYRNGKLWAAHTVFFGAPGPVGRAAVKWWQIDPTSAGVLQSGLVDDPGGTNFYAFPSLAVNKFDDALLGFSCFAGTRFASACYAFRKSTDAPGTFQDVATLKEGLAKYYKIFTGSVNRWGDFSATQVDPQNDVDFWTIQEYAMLPSGQDRWGTWWGQLALPPDVTISDVSLPEGNSGTTNARFTVSLSFPSTQTVQVDWIAADGTATQADGDYQAASGQVSFPPGTTTQFVDVPVVGDLKFEPNETFVVNLSNPVRGVVTDAQGQATIQNDDLQPLMSIDDVRVVEGNAGTANAIFTVTLSNPSGAPAQATWSTSNGSAMAPGDYATNSGVVSFVPGDTSETLIVLVAGELVPEANETFQVDLAAPTGALLGQSRGVGTILDDDGATFPDVTAFTIVSSGATGATSGLNRLQWVNPVGASPTELRFRFNKGLGCTSPDPAFPNGASFGVITLFAPFGAPGEARAHDHTGLDLGTSYCYTVWAIYAGPNASAGVSGIGRPFNATGRVKWKYSTGTGTTGVAPPTVAVEGILAVDNSGDVHAMARSATGGGWPIGPPPWNPADLASPSQARNPWVPLSLGSRLYLTTQDGRAHAIGAQSGAVAWSTPLSPAAVTAAPAGIFASFGGEHDALFVGTSAADNNVFHALDPATGAPLTSFGPPGIGPVTGMAVVDYSRSPQNRVYFASRQGTAPETLWCLNLGPAGPRHVLAALEGQPRQHQRQSGAAQRPHLRRDGRGRGEVRERRYRQPRGRAHDRARRRAGERLRVPRPRERRRLRLDQQHGLAPHRHGSDVDDAVGRRGDEPVASPAASGGDTPLRRRRRRQAPPADAPRRRAHVPAARLRPALVRGGRAVLRHRLRSRPRRERARHLLRGGGPAAMRSAWLLACALFALAAPERLVAHDEPAGPRPTPHRPPPVTCEVSDIRSPQARHHRQGFRATRIVELEFEARLQGRSTRERRLQLRLYTPKGFLYQVLELSLEGAASRRRVFEARLPVAGTSIMTSGLYGRWKVVPHLDDERTPCGRAQSFVLKP